jgi:hypothetical protein
METQINKLREYYSKGHPKGKISYEELAQKIGITKRQLQNVRKGKHIGKFLKLRIDEMVQKIESL